MTNSCMGSSKIYVENDVQGQVVLGLFKLNPGPGTDPDRKIKIRILPTMVSPQVVEVSEAERTEPFNRSGSALSQYGR